MHTLCGGRRTPASFIHITLAFLGAVAVSRVAELQRLAAQLESAAFDIELTHSGCWQRSRIAWVAPVQIPQALTDLVDKLRCQLQTAGYSVDLRAYAPHVTLLRKANCPPLLPAITTMSWTAHDFVLVKSGVVEHEPSYEIIGRWPLLPL